MHTNVQFPTTNRPGCIILAGGTAFFLVGGWQMGGWLRAPGKEFQEENPQDGGESRTEHVHS